MDVRRGNFFLNNNGVIEADVFRFTNGGQNSFTFNGGTLNVRSSAAANGQTFFVGNGVNAATLNLVGNNNHFFNALTLRSNATLSWQRHRHWRADRTGRSNVSPGTSAGKIILSNSPSLQALCSWKSARPGRRELTTSCK
jgi:hypothetical protein